MTSFLRYPPKPLTKFLRRKTLSRKTHYVTTLLLPYPKIFDTMCRASAITSSKSCSNVHLKVNFSNLTFPQCSKL